jgi:hypothetical protein
VIIDRLARARPRSIPDGAELSSMPQSLDWTPVPGATHYQVFVRDLWDDSEIVLAPKLLDQPWIRFPEGLIEPGGAYTWQVHARDGNGHPLLGDFNHGSLGRVCTFSVSDR